MALAIYKENPNGGFTELQPPSLAIEFVQCMCAVANNTLEKFLTDARMTDVHQLVLALNALQSYQNQHALNNGRVPANENRNAQHELMQLVNAVSALGGTFTDGQGVYIGGPKRTTHGRTKPIRN